MLEATPSDEGANTASDPELDRLVGTKRAEARGRGPRGRPPLPEGVDVDYPLRTPVVRGSFCQPFQAGSS
jgi:hypothetical protein